MDPGLRRDDGKRGGDWIPAFAGMTEGQCRMRDMFSARRLPFQAKNFEAESVKNFFPSTLKISSFCTICAKGISPSMAECLW